MPKNNIGYAKPPEPKFIREMKAKLGYREPEESIRDKLVGDAGDFDDREGEQIAQYAFNTWTLTCLSTDRDDEKPTIVVMKNGDLTEEEAKEEETLLLKLEDEKKVAEGKIEFKKPVKRDNDADKKDSDEPKRKKDKKESRKEKKKNLLSFDEDEEEEYQ